ncbi:glycosyltransferase family 39 protein [Nitrospira sp. MA-1]|nr:glycosyltransferase family 39 protein [Nitrospira sp. MA-1]
MGNDHHGQRNLSFILMNTSWGAFLERPAIHIPLLLVIGFLAFSYNASISLFGETEGLYAIVTHTMMAAEDYVHLWLRGEPYFNKPPLFFWLQAGFIHGLGWSEAALRLPSIVSSMGTMITTYFLGRLLFSGMAGFWGALVCATCYAGLWFGPLAIIDPVLTFCMTVGMYAWARAYFQESSQGWYVVGFVALALGSMVKTLHALALPILVVGIFLWLRRDRRVFREPYFWVGVVLSGLLLGVYYLLLGQEFRQHFFFEENLKRMITVSGDQKHSAWEAYWGKRPIFWYGLVIWFDAFPWSALFPVGLFLIWKRRPWLESPKELWVFLWVVVYFVALSLAPEKHERYLMPLLPAFGLLVGYVYHRLLYETSASDGWGPLRGMLGCLGIVFVVAVILGPILIQKKWHVPLDIIPLALRLGLGILGLMMIGLAMKNYLRMGLVGVGVLGIALMVTVTGFIIPGIQAEGSPRLAFDENQRRLNNQTDPILVFQSWDWREDEDEFYWDYLHGYSRIVGKGLGDFLALEELKRDVQQSTRMVMMTKDQYQRVISGDPNLNAIVLFEFYRSKKNIVLLSLDWRTQLADSLEPQKQ